MVEFNLVNVIQRQLGSASNGSRSGSATEAGEASFLQFLNDFHTKNDFLVPKANFTPLEVVARKQGTVLLSQWLDSANPFQALHEALELNPGTESIQLTLVTARQSLNAQEREKWLRGNIEGRFGLEVSLSGFIYRVSPFETLATNRSLYQWFEDWLVERALTRVDFDKLGGKFARLVCRQFIFNCINPYAVTETFRGNIVVSPTAPLDLTVDKIIGGMCRWFMTNQSQDGGVPYKYWPSSGVYSTQDNPIRRFMATIAFNRLGVHLGRSDIKAAARKNLQFNLQRFYRFENHEGQIFWSGSVKLGALALAGLAIVESPFRSEWEGQLSEIRKSVDKLWQPDGAFRTFLHPADRNDNQNFYPGETLLFWAVMLQKHRDEELLSRTLASVDYYRNFFRAEPNPAFVPWHTQAVAILFKLTGDDKLRDYIFEMNDWLLPHQQWGDPVAKDCWGRFYSPDKPYGAPHASATGVYLEGLVDALLMALECGDTQRAANYYQAIHRGVRSIAQLQFQNSLDTYYIHHKERVLGAIRTEVANNEIRVDNLQHPLMALLRFQALVQRNPESMKTLKSVGVQI